MQDRPSRTELLQGIINFLEDDALPNLEGGAQFRARVASNVAGMLLRELDRGEEDLRSEYIGLAVLLGWDTKLPASIHALERAVLEMNEALAARIRAGDADAGDFRARTLDHLRDVTVRKLDVTNPKLAQAIRAELVGDEDAQT